MILNFIRTVRRTLARLVSPSVDLPQEGSRVLEKLLRVYPHLLESLRCHLLDVLALDRLGKLRISPKKLLNVCLRISTALLHHHGNLLHDLITVHHRMLHLPSFFLLLP